MDDDELLRTLTRIAQQDPPGDPRRRKLGEEARPDDARSAQRDDADAAKTAEPADPAASTTGAGREGRGARVPLDDETRARLADELIAQLRDTRGDAPAPPSLPRPMVDRKSGIRFRSPHEWDGDADEPGDAADAPPLGADADSLSGTSAPSTTDAPVCRAIGGDSVPPGASEPPRDARPSAAPAQPAQRAPDGADAGALAPRPGPLLVPELVVERRSAPRAKIGARVRTAVGVAGWVVSAALVSLLALRPAPFAPGAAPLPDYTIATTLGAGPQQGDRDPGAPRRVGRGARITIALSPDARVPSPVAVKAFLVQGGKARSWPVDIELDGSGGARVSGTREALFRDVAAGPCEVVFVIGQPGSPPVDAEAPPDQAAVQLAGGRLLRQRLFLD
ncbi:MULTISPECIES: hypothetical protein [Sorangium]|uniref:Uncharacterized protein n=1 Tax=Sorangium cellulosum TaxID=56 RepID=A0A4P2QIE6_SORCE|nr:MULTISPECIES: hypothetical protein [Sorangium]AUX29351.1 hypothetical protein SOCE836_014390 [Sorangium cellulosum]WCQ88744.1 hypothetical protein NQZ70_01425 [Sorangium sp. Soce836]